ncbi:hypothetical protein AWB67_07653 [Caballeronia terrestris]|uniref:Uncharacterized protein n=1 Tax=Caballeronia terrestris TaxID=1226301 RepID=A0A158L639_9BURK|nr:hypothetical protein AWB67_07653 [Caballeronia terrestris]
MYHSEPEDTPAHDAEYRDEIGQPVCGAQLRIFCLATRFQNLVKHLYFPSQRVPVEFLDSLLARSDRQVGDQLPLNAFAARGYTSFEGVNDGQLQGGITTLLADWWEYRYAAVSKFQYCVLSLTVLVANSDTVNALDPYFIHLIGNRMAAISRKPVDAGSHQEIRLQLLSQAEEFVNITFAISYMNASLRLPKKCC